MDKNRHEQFSLRIHAQAGPYTHGHIHSGTHTDRHTVTRIRTYTSVHGHTAKHRDRLANRTHTQTDIPELPRINTDTRIYGQTDKHRDRQTDIDVGTHGHSGTRVHGHKGTTGTKSHGDNGHTNG